MRTVVLVVTENKSYNRTIPVPLHRICLLYNSAAYHVLLRSISFVSRGVIVIEMPLISS